jgi:hypothetical protein
VLSTFSPAAETESIAVAMTGVDWHVAAGGMPPPSKSAHWPDRHDPSSHATALDPPARLDRPAALRVATRYVWAVLVACEAAPD